MKRLKSGIILSGILLSGLLCVPGVASPKTEDSIVETTEIPHIRELSEELISSARSLDKWKWDKTTGLRLEKIEKFRDGFWVSPEKVTPDGTLRASFIVGNKPDSSFFFRAEFPEKVHGVHGYSVSFAKKKILLHRWDGGSPRQIGDSVTIKKMPSKIDVVIAMQGVYVNISVQDSKTHKELAKLTMDDVRYMGTQTGYRVHRRPDKTSALAGYDFTPSEHPENLHFTDSDAYLTQQAVSFVFAPKEKVETLNELKQCKIVKSGNVENYEIYRCSHQAMMKMVDNNRKLPEGFYWAIPRTAYTDSEYREAAVDLNCPTPMHCNEKAPLDPNRSAKDVDMIQAYIDAYVPVCARRASRVRVETIGQTYLGHPIRAIVLTSSKDQNPPKVLFNGAHHGMELLACDMAFDILEELCETTDAKLARHYASILEKAEVWIIPTVNLDGNDLFYHVSEHFGRKNGRHVFLTQKKRPSFPAKSGNSRTSAYYRYHPNDIELGSGVDINRNYPLQWGATGEKASSEDPKHYWYRGEFPGSEPEIQAMMNLFHTQQFAASISFHTVSTKILSPYSIDALKDPPRETDHAWQLALKMAQAAGVQASGKPYEVVKNLYSVDGTDQDWFRMISGTYAYLIEGSLHNPKGEQRRDALLKNRPAWQTLLDAVPQATTVYVKDGQGNPLMAEVRYSDEAHLNDEHWMTQCRDGSHTMLCFGSREITVTLPDGTSQKKKVSCRSYAQNNVEFVFETASAGDVLASIPSQTRSLMGVDAICDMKHRQCPHLPAQRWCLIEDTCIPSGQKASSNSDRYCNPVENNRDWTKL